MELRQSITWRSRFILIFIAGFIGAVLVSSFVFIPPLLSLLFFFLGGAILLAEKVHHRRVTTEVLVISLILISFSLGALRYAVKDFHEISTPSQTGLVVSEPEDRDNSRRFVFLSENGEKVLVSTTIYDEVQYGDRVGVSGEFKRPGIILDEESGREFDYGKYLSKDDIYHTLTFGEVKVLSSGHGNSIKAFLFKVKGSFVAKAKEILSEPYASLLMGLIVAGKEALPQEILEDFRRAGVVHIVVLSGFNITLIAEFMRRLFQNLFLLLGATRFPQLPALASILGVILFVIMTGGEATVVRASIMALIVIVGTLSNRSYSPLRALIAAGFIMILENPKILVFDPSFQLSFLATLGLILISPHLEKRFEAVTNQGQLRTVLSQTLATQITVLPLLIYLTGELSIVSLPANILILSIVPITMLIGFLATLLAYLGSLIAWPLTLASHLLLSWILWVASVFGGLSFATIKIPIFSLWVLFLFYLIPILYWRSRSFSHSSPS